MAGEVDGVRGPVTEIYADPEYLDIALPAGVDFEQPVPRGHTAFAYVFEGEGRFGDGRGVGDRGEAVGELLAARAGRVRRRRRRARRRRHVAGPLPARLGRPLGEPIARYGPFVMNTREEMQLALRDLQDDTFVWRDDAEWARRRVTWAPPA